MAASTAVPNCCGNCTWSTCAEVKPNPMNEQKLPMQSSAMTPAVRLADDLAQRATPARALAGAAGYRRLELVRGAQPR
ncbi:hypothetical protein [Streptacidiphilus sp. MAP5-3]|uniref:hypothetical protein n=1 Tax=unclassified Streptacidiphilus TaxID=2643834 RepID=UPI003516E6FF